MRMDPWWKLWSSLIASFSNMSIPGQRGSRLWWPLDCVPHLALPSTHRGLPPSVERLEPVTVWWGDLKGPTWDISAVATQDPLKPHRESPSLSAQSAPFFLAWALPDPLRQVCQASLYCREYFQGKSLDRHHCRFPSDLLSLGTNK